MFEQQGPRPEVIVYSDRLALSRGAADQFIDLAQEAIRQRGRFTVALSGGSTPRGVFSLLAQLPDRDRVDWSRLEVFWGDERNVPPDHADSNYGLAEAALLRHVPIPASQIHRIPTGGISAADAAARFAETLWTSFHLGATEYPRFDLIHLGLGPEGHTASLFPHTAALGETARLAVANYVPKLQADRITLTVPVINNARQISFLVAGADKAEMVQTILHGPHEPLEYPAQLIRPADGHLSWLLDAEAAAKLGH